MGQPNETPIAALTVPFEMPIAALTVPFLEARRQVAIQVIVFAVFAVSL